MPADQKCSSGERQDIRYAFYDKGQDSKNNGWAWFHRALTPDEINKFYHDHFKARFGNSVPDGKGFVRFNERRIVYRYFPAGKDEKGRDHWVLLLAWLTADIPPSEVQKVLDDAVFQHVASGKRDLPEQLLSPFDYHADIVKLTYDGAKATVSAAKAWWYIEEITKRGAVNITFYCEKSDGSATIETQKKSS